MNPGRKTGSSSSGNSVLNVRSIPAILMTGVLIACVSSGIRSVRAADPPKTTLDGIFTFDQAARGKTVYTNSCSACHMDDLSGSGQALPLAGDAFMEVWDGQTVADLLDLVHNTMPQDKPGSLTAEASLDVISYVLQYNKFPAGTDELKNDPAALKNIVITKKAAAPPAPAPATK
jgi:S-disulfanyl-L-cysteine oxidoreductase SoxD